MIPIDTLKTRKTLTVNHKNYDYYSLKAVEESGLGQVSRLPVSLKILLENLLRHEDGKSVTTDDIKGFVGWLQKKTSTQEIAFRPARVLMQDFTGVPALVDLAAMRDAVKKNGGDPNQINPLTPVDLVIDHSIQVDQAGNADALNINSRLEMERNLERYQFLRWGQKAFQNFRVVPPGTGICHQINLEFLAKSVWIQSANNQLLAFPDTVVGTDSHTTMINGLGVLGWGVGGIEAEAAMLGQPISMLIPEVIGVRLTGELSHGVNATDLVLAITHLLRQKGVVGKFVEYYGPGLTSLSLADRATLANMAPEYGATCGFFPIDQATIDYLRLTGRDEELIALVECYAKTQGLWYDPDEADPDFTDTLDIDLKTIETFIAGPKRPQDRVTLSQMPNALTELMSKTNLTKKEQGLTHGAVVIAAITSCTNTSNPSVLMAAGLLAKKAVAKGLKAKPWVKASLAPGSQVVSRYLMETGLQYYLDSLGFSIVGFGCTTCIGNSGPLSDNVTTDITSGDLIVSAVLSGNRNFEGRIHPLVKANWLASPPLVVAFALAGTTQIDLSEEPLGHDQNGKPVYLKDIWPSHEEITDAMRQVTQSLYREQYRDVFSGSAEWQSIDIVDSQTFPWQPESTYIQNPPYFINLENESKKISNIKNARILALLGDSITTDHISPAGSIKSESPAGRFLLSKGVSVKDFNSLGARRGNHEVMMRGTFANIRIKNEMLSQVEGGLTKHMPSGETLSIYDAAMRYKETQTPTIVVAGKEYGTGSSRDWAAKGPKLLGVVAVIANSFERIHRTNLIGMGILPLEFQDGVTRKTLNLTGDELIDIMGLSEKIVPRMTLNVIFRRPNGDAIETTALCRIDTLNEVDYYVNDGILSYVLRNLSKADSH